MEDIYFRIKFLRIKNGFSQQKLAELVGYNDKTAIAHIEAGRIDIPQSKILAFAKALGTSVSYLLDGYEDPEEEIKAEALKLYYKYIAADKKTRKMIDMLLEEGD